MNLLVAGRSSAILVYILCDQEAVQAFFLHPERAQWSQEKDLGCWLELDLTAHHFYLGAGKTNRKTLSFTLKHRWAFPQERMKRICHFKENSGPCLFSVLRSKLSRQWTWMFGWRGRATKALSPLPTLLPFLPRLLGGDELPGPGW